jgi:hypothetical protein
VPWRSVNALNDPRQPLPAQPVPSTDGATLLLLPASILTGDAFIISGPQLFSLGWSATLNNVDATLTDPSGNSYDLLPLVNGFPALTFQRIDDASGTYFSLGLPPGSGVATTALFDSCANISIIPLAHKSSLINNVAGGPLVLGASVTITTLGDGLLPIRCFPRPTTAPMIPMAVTQVHPSPPPSLAPTATSSSDTSLQRAELDAAAMARLQQLRVEGAIISDETDPERIAGDLDAIADELRSDEPDLAAVLEELATLRATIAEKNQSLANYVNGLAGLEQANYYGKLLGEKEAVIQVLHRACVERATDLMDGRVRGRQVVKV